MLPEKRYAVVITPACRNEFHVNEGGGPIFWQASPTSRTRICLTASICARARKDLTSVATLKYQCRITIANNRWKERDDLAISISKLFLVFSLMIINTFFPPLNFRHRYSNSVICIKDSVGR